MQLFGFSAYTFTFWGENCYAKSQILHVDSNFARHFVYRFRTDSAGAKDRKHNEDKTFFPKDDTNGEIEFVAVEREVKKTSAVADIAIRELLKGVNEAEKKLNLISTYEVKDIVNGREECASDKTKPLAAYFIGVKIKKGIAIVNFRSGGACYLDTAITAADYVMKPIEATLKQFPSIKGINYAINGKVITEWDA